MRKKYFVYILIFVFALITFFCYRDAKDSVNNYDVIYVGNGHMKIIGSKENYVIESNGNACLAESNDYVFIGFDLPNALVNDKIYDILNKTPSEVSEFIDIQNEEELIKYLGINESDVIISGHVNKPSFNKYVVRYIQGESIVTVGMYKKDNRCLVQVIKDNNSNISETEYKKIFAGLSY